MRNNLEVKVPLAQTNSLLLATAAVTTGCGNNLKAKFESKRQRTASMSSRLGFVENIASGGINHWDFDPF